MRLTCYMSRMRERSGEVAGSFPVEGEILSWCQDLADEDGSIHIDMLMDLANDQEKLDRIEFLLGIGLINDYVFLED